jgi:hypothetical protein
MALAILTLFQEQAHSNVIGFQGTACYEYDLKTSSQFL